MKIFVSYSRRDAGDLAEQIRSHLTTFKHTVFTDINSINAGDIWSNILEDNITNCDIFVVIITHGSLASSNVEKEALQAQRDKKRIIPCVHRNVILRGVESVSRMWGLEKFQGIEFDNKYDLARDLYLKIEQYQKDIEGKQLFEFAIEEGDLVTFSSDAIELKYAQEFYGAEYQVAITLEKEGIALDSLRPLPNKYCYVESIDSIKARYVLFIGVLPPPKFQYKQVREFSEQVINVVSKELPKIEHIAVTIHGVGFGLDESESFLAEFAGIQDAMLKNRSSTFIKRISIIDRNPDRIKRLRDKFQSKLSSAATHIRQLKPDGSLYQIYAGNRFQRVTSGDAITRINTDSIDSAGFESESKPHIFVAMPFMKQMEDVFVYGIQNPTNAAGFLCERIDNEVFIGEIMNQVKKRIESAAVVIADLSGSNPNVYLEVGYAWGKGRPTILLKKTGEEAKFDVRGHRYLEYETIRDLEEKLNNELKQLKSKDEI